VAVAGIGKPGAKSLQAADNGDLWLHFPGFGSNGFPISHSLSGYSHYKDGLRKTAPFLVTRSKLKTCSLGLSAQRPTMRRGKSGEPSSSDTLAPQIEQTEK
jgi:hypothetical protein